MNWGEISSTFHYWYYLDLLLDHRFIHILNSVVLKMEESLQDRRKFNNSTRGAKKMAFKGFQYGKDKQMDTKIYWKCDDLVCKVCVVTSSGEPVTILRLSFLEACALHYFGKLLSFSHYLIFQRIFDDISTDVHLTSCLSMKIQQMVAFDVMSDSTESRIQRKGFRGKVMDAQISYSCELSMKFVIFINIKMQTNEAFFFSEQQTT